MIAESTPAASDQTVDQIFELLKRKGPLCASQISVELLVPLRDVVRGLTVLKEEGLVEPRSDDPGSSADDVTSPYGLIRKLVARRATSN
jgi:DNA-binding transcriptional ArsR family regulator